MLPTKKQLIVHLSEKMTNQDIAKIYGTTFQKIIQNWLNNEVVYVGSGAWYRCRRYTNRRNSEHRQLMPGGKLMYKFVGEFDEE